MNIEKEIAKFAEREREEAKEARQKEKTQVCIDPDSYIAKEIKYQTVLLRQILYEVQNINRKKQGPKSPFFRSRNQKKQERRNNMKADIDVARLTDDPLKNIIIMAPLLDEAGQNRVFGLMCGLIAGCSDKPKSEQRPELAAV